jgi:predicted metal-dependent enzyme (double-stranded beta helix superfamily)
VPEPSREPQERNPVADALKRFIWDIQSMVELEASEREILFIGRDLMRRLVESDSWLPQCFAEPNPQRCHQFQLYRDDLERFTIASTVFAGSQTSPIMQDQVWEIAGVLRGTLERTRFSVSAGGKPEPKGAPSSLPSGAVDTRSADSRDAIQLRNSMAGETAISIHVYGGEISQLPRQSFAPDGGVNEAPATYANDESTPPYDILSIQTRIVD